MDYRTGNRAVSKSKPGVTVLHRGCRECADRAAFSVFGGGSCNVLIGPNGSEKSNLIDVIRLLRACPRDIRERIIRGGGVTEWIWKGKPRAEASIEAIVSKIRSEIDHRDINLTEELTVGLDAKDNGRIPLRHLVSFRSQDQTFRIESEIIEDERGNIAEVGQAGKGADFIAFLPIKSG
jgi:predicted ATPase